MASLYLDSNIVIVLLEEKGARRRALRADLAKHAGPHGRCFVSDLVRLECRVKPIANGDTDLLREYDEYFASTGVAIAGISSSVYDRATAIRAAFRYETADALHLAATIEAGCDAFVTADKRLAGFPDLTVEVLDPMVEPGT